MSVPPSGMASRELSARFTSACSIWPRSASIGQSSVVEVGRRARCARRACARGAPRGRRRRRSGSSDSSDCDSWRLKIVQLPRQRGAAPGRAPDLLDVGAHRGALVELVDDELRVVDDHAEDVVEVVGDAAGELTDGLEPAGLAELGVDRLAPGSPLRPTSPGCWRSRSPSRSAEMSRSALTASSRARSRRSATIASTGSSLTSPLEPLMAALVDLQRRQEGLDLTPDELVGVAARAASTSRRSRRGRAPTRRLIRIAAGAASRSRSYGHRPLRSQSSSLPPPGRQLG